MSKARIVVVGGSAGGVQALQALVAMLPADLQACVLVVLHIGMHPSLLPGLLSSKGPLPARHARDGESLRPGHILVAPPDQHLLVEGYKVRLSRGPKEHHTRPALDPLFRSAALAWGPAAVGVVLTGKLDDGTAGLQAIKACGGIAIVQDPSDAAEPSMPASALKYAEVDHCVPLAAIGPLLVSLTGSQKASPARVQGPPALEHEHRLSLGLGDPMEHLESIGSPSTFVCPDCKGSLWQLTGTRPLRYRCHTGHAFSARSLQYAQAEAADQAVWAAVRALKEKQMLLAELAAAFVHEGDLEESARCELLARQVEKQADELRVLVETLPDPAIAEAPDNEVPSTPPSRSSSDTID